MYLHALWVGAHKGYRALEPLSWLQAVLEPNSGLLQEQLALALLTIPLVPQLFI